MELNKYLGRTHALVEKYKAEAPFKQFQNLGGESAAFDDLIWFHIDPNTGKKTRLLTGEHGRDVDFLSVHADASACGDEDVLVVKGIVELRQALIGS